MHIYIKHHLHIRMKFFTCLLILSLTTTIHATLWEDRGGITCVGGYKKRLADGTVECETSCSRDTFRDTYKDANGNNCCPQKNEEICVQIKQEYELECGSCGSCFDEFRSNGMNYAKLDLSSWTSLDENSPLVQNLNDPNHAFVGTSTYFVFGPSHVEITKAQTFKNYRLEVDCTDPELEPFCTSCETLCQTAGAKVMMTTFSDPNQAYCYHTGALCTLDTDCGEGDYCTNDFQHLITVLYTADDGTPMNPFVIDGAELGEALTQQDVQGALAEYGAETAVNNAVTDGYTNLFACWSGETGACPESSGRRRRLLSYRKGKC